MDQLDFRGRRREYVLILFMLGTLTLVLNGLRPFNLGIPLSDILYLLALVFLVFDGMGREEPSSQWMPLHFYWLPALAILLGGLLSSINSASPLISIFVTLKISYLFSLWMSMIIAMVRTKGGVENAIAALIVGVVFTSAVAVLDSLTGMALGPRIYGLDPKLSGLDPLLYSQTSGRLSGTLGHPNHLGQITAVALPIICDRAMVFLGEKRAGYRGLMLVAAAILVFWANLLSGSISGLIGATVGMTIVVGLRIRRNNYHFRILRLFLLGAGAVLVVGLFIELKKPDSGGLSYWLATNVQRVITITGPGRISLVHDALEEIARNPIVGYGMDQGTFGANPSSAVLAIGIHNTILQGWLGGGLLTFIGVLLVYSKTMHMALRALIEQLRQPSTSYTLGLAASIVGWVLIDMTSPSISIRWTWLTVGLLYGTMIKERKEFLPRWIEPHTGRVTSKASD